jgi:hypothetical protein
MVAPVLINRLMTSSIAPSASCAFGVALISGVSEICQFVYLSEPRSKLISVLTVAVASLFTFVAISLLAGPRQRKGTHEGISNANEVSEVDPIAQRTLTRIILATEHIGSLLLVFRIAREYNQPISSGALHNLTLVEKDLRGLQMELEDQMYGSQTIQDRPRSDNTGHFEAPAIRDFSSTIDHATKL